MQVSRFEPWRGNSPSGRSQLPLLAGAGDSSVRVPHRPIGCGGARLAAAAGPARSQPSSAPGRLQNRNGIRASTTLFAGLPEPLQFPRDPPILAFDRRWGAPHLVPRSGWPRTRKDSRRNHAGPSHPGTKPLRCPTPRPKRSNKGMQNETQSRHDHETGGSPAHERRPWVQPAVEDLPRLTDLTLQTGDPIPGGGGTGGGGSTVF